MVMDFLFAICWLFQNHFLRAVEEIPGLSKQYDMEFFRNLENRCGIRLENIVYYKVEMPVTFLTSRQTGPHPLLCDDCKEGQLSEERSASQRHRFSHCNVLIKC